MYSYLKLFSIPFHVLVVPLRIFSHRIPLFYLHSQSLSMTSILLSKGEFSTFEHKKKVDKPIQLQESNRSLHLSYEKCLRKLYMTNMYHPVKMGLENMKSLHDALGNPMDSSLISVIHIAGTNGKGSVALKIAKTLHLGGHNVGLFMSPHLSCFRERIQVNGIHISELEVIQYLPHIFYICKSRRIPATLFEIITALAFKYFSVRNTDIVVLETGLGGRLDATNVVDYPVLSIITSIGLDHMSILGNTIAKISREKSGIIKKGVPLLVGSNLPYDVIFNYAKEKGASCYYTYSDIISKSEKVNIAMRDSRIIWEDIEVIDYEIENSNMATAALYLLCKDDIMGKFKSLTEKHIIEGTSYTLPCRFEIFHVKKRPSEISDEHQTLSSQFPKLVNKSCDIFDDGSIIIILDVAHNPSAICLLAAKLQKTYPITRKRLVVGFSSDKNLRHCSRCLLTIVNTPNNIHLTQASHPRAASIEAMLHAEPYLSKSNYDMSDRSILKQIQLAFDLACKKNEIVIVCGSVFLMSEAREALGFDEPRDSKHIFEGDSAFIKHDHQNYVDTTQKILK